MFDPKTEAKVKHNCNCLDMYVHVYAYMCQWNVDCLTDGALEQLSKANTYPANEGSFCP